MIIDSHCHHFYNVQPEELTEFLSLMAELWGVIKPRNEMTDWYAAHIADLNTYDAFVGRMDEAGIDKAVLLYSDNTDYGNSEETVLGIHEHISKIVERHPTRIIPFGSIDPRRPGAPELFRRCIQEHGMKGLKWHPDNGYYPNSEESFEMLEVASELEVPLLTHSGPLPGKRAEFSHPIHLDDVTYSFPKLKIIAAHMGDTWWREWLALVRYKRNIYGDLAIWQFTATGNPSKFKAILREIIDSVGSKQVLFGTDAPCFESVVSNGSYVETLKSLANDPNDDLTFTHGEIDDILGGNAARILNI
jgi:predicted TIM-barrel fold metal-dependent hydrolase